VPLVRIDLNGPRDAAQLDALSDAVQSAMVETIGIPADDRFHLFSTASTRVYDRAYLGIARSDNVMFVEITLRGGRTAEQKKNLYAEIAKRAGAAAGVAPADVFVALHENGAGDWSFGNGEMQYAHMLGPPAP
jgi:phenylpyruvate tautomerase PptA (4-oxalocrotonate tautomerase family)